jgi:hypothetical protein
LAQAEEGLLHVTGVPRERDEVREEFDESALGTQQSPGFSGIRARVRRADRTSDSRTSTEDLDRDDPTRDPFLGPVTTGGLANA